MYSVLLAAMLTAGGQATTWHHGCHGGCYGGCHGGYGAFNWCHGGYGGCSGCWGCYGCWGGSSCYGCWGGYSSCYGCWGGYSSCYGCYGSCYGCYGSIYPTYTWGCGGGGVIYSNPMPAPGKEKGKDFQPPNPKEKEVSQTNVARVTVTLPADAKLWVDNVACPLTSSTRSFNTPALEPGRQYYYTLAIQINRDGQTFSDNRRVYVSAGQQVNVDFNNVATASR